MADVLLYLLIVVGFYVVFISYWLVSESLFPHFIECCRITYISKPMVSTGVGLIVTIPVLLIGIGLITHMGNPALLIIGFGLIFLLVLTGLMGSAGLCRQIGLGLGIPIDEGQPWRRVLRGGIVLGLTFLLPFVGWFAVMPWVLISGLGVFFQTCLEWRRSHPKSLSTTV